MSGTLPSPRVINRALAVLEALPGPVLAHLAERLIDRLDALDGDIDREDGDGDCCEAGDDDPASSRPDQGVRGAFWSGGDPADDEAGPDEEGPWWTPTEGTDGCSPVMVPG